MTSLGSIATNLLDGDTADLGTVQLHPLGTKAGDSNGNEYIYLKGIVSTEAGSWVSFDENHETTLLVANAKGRVAVAMAAIVADNYGWYQIYGENIIAKALAGFVDNGVPYATATAGSVDDAVVAGDLVVGAMGRSAVSGGVITVELNYPFATDTLG
jgi:hypothetical protein